MVGQHAWVARAKIVAGDDLLPFRRVEIFQVSGGDFFCTVFGGVHVDHRDRRLGQDALARVDDLKVIGIALFDHEQRLIFPGDKDVALTALHEKDGGIARAGAEDPDVAVEGLDEITRLLLVAARGVEGVAVSRKEIPARAAGVFGFGVTISTPGLMMSGQSLIPFGFPLRTRSHDGRRVG